MVFSRRLTRGKLLDFFAGQPRCVVALEACGGAHHWARQLQAMGYEVRLIPPAYVKPFMKRHKNDAIDAEAICEAAQCPGMRFVAVKTEAQQAAGLAFRTRDSCGAPAYAAHQRDPWPLGGVWQVEQAIEPNGRHSERVKSKFVLISKSSFEQQVYEDASKRAGALHAGSCRHPAAVYPVCSGGFSSPSIIMKNARIQRIEKVTGSGKRGAFSAFAPPAISIRIRY